MAATVILAGWDILPVDGVLSLMRDLPPPSAIKLSYRTVEVQVGLFLEPHAIGSLHACMVSLLLARCSFVCVCRSALIFALIRRTRYGWHRNGARSLSAVGL